MPSRATLALLFAAAFGVFGFLARGHLESADSVATLQGAKAWYKRGSPALLTAAQAAAAPDLETWPLEHLLADTIGDPVRPTYGRLGRDDRAFVWFPIGHQAMFVPCVALGDALGAMAPEPERVAERALGPIFGPDFWAQFVASFLSPLASAGSFVCLLWLALTLGANRRDALIAAGVAVFCTQFWPGTNETMSNAPGTFFLFAYLLCIARYALADRAGPRTLLVAGLVAGAGVLVRYPQAIAVLIGGLWALHAAWRRRRPWDLVYLVLGGVPWAGLLLWLNWWRFADAFETGYSNSAGFGGLPAHVGAFMILCSFGKGVLWFSPLLFWIVPLAFRRAARGPWTLVAGAIFVVTLALYSVVVYWAAGQCWGIRYMSAPIALLTVVVLARSTPWRAHPRAFAAAASVGAVLSIGGLIAPYPGQQHFAMHAGAVIYDHPPTGLDNNVNHCWQLSPLHSHWSYAALMAQGRIARGGSGHTTKPLFGVDVPDVPGVAPTLSGFRHVWWRWLDHVCGGSAGFWLALLWLAATAACARIGLSKWFAGAPAG